MCKHAKAIFQTTSIHHTLICIRTAHTTKTVMFAQIRFRYKSLLRNGKSQAAGARIIQGIKSSHHCEGITHAWHHKSVNRLIYIKIHKIVKKHKLYNAIFSACKLPYDTRIRQLK